MSIDDLVVVYADTKCTRRGLDSDPLAVKGVTRDLDMLGMLVHVDTHALRGRARLHILWVGRVEHVALDEAGPAVF